MRLYRDETPVALGIAESIADPMVDFPVNLSGLGDGTYSFTATSEDPVGNRSESSSQLLVTIDTTAPDIESLVLDSASDTGNVGDQTTDHDLVRLTGRTEPNAIVSVAGTEIVVVADGSGEFQIDDVPLRFGPNAITVSSADSLGNTNSRSINLFRPRGESEPPQIAVSLAEDTGRYPSDALTQSIELTGAVADASEVTGLFLSAEQASSEQSIESTFPVADVSDALSGTTFRLTTQQIETALGSTLDDGQITFSLQAVDVFQNRSAPTSVTLDLDRTSPDAPALMGLAGDSDFGIDDQDAVTRSTSLSLLLSIDEPSRIDVQVNGVEHANFMLPAGDGRVTVTGLTDGEQQITLTSTDLAGNTSAVSDSLVVTIDTVAPDAMEAQLILPSDGSDCRPGDRRNRIRCCRVAVSRVGFQHADCQDNCGCDRHVHVQSNQTQFGSQSLSCRCIGLGRKHARDRLDRTLRRAGSIGT